MVGLERAGVAELVDAHDSKSCVARRESSSLSSGTILLLPFLFCEEFIYLFSQS
jgi:hypothetical protein